MNLTFQAQFEKASTTIDGGWRITFVLGNQEAENVIKLNELKDHNLQIAVIPIVEGEL